MAYCKNCKYYKHTGEYSMEGKFISGTQNQKGDFPILDYTLTSEGFSIKNCTHSICYSKENAIIDFYGNKRYDYKRVEGCATLNVNKDCKYFKPKLLYKLFGRK